MNDKQFQTAVSSVKVPATLYDVGRDTFNPDAWCDLREYLEAIDCWNLFCTILSGNFRIVLDGLESLSLGGNLVSLILEAAPLSVLVGHSEITVSLSRWHASHVLESPMLLWASLASVVCRDRIIRRLVLAAINPKAKNFLRSTVPRENGIFRPMSPHCTLGVLRRKMCGPLSPILISCCPARSLATDLSATGAPTWTSGAYLAGASPLPTSPRI